MGVRFEPVPALLASLLVACPADVAPPDPTDDDDAADDDDSAPDDDDSAADDDDSAANVPPEPTTPAQERGRDLYATYCALCHGAFLEGSVDTSSPSLSTPSFLATATDAFLEAGIAHGRPGTAMSAWGTDWAGPLAPEEVSDLVAWIRAWQRTATLDVHDLVVVGDPEGAEGMYAGYCADCHGAAGEGESASALANPWFLHTASDGFIRHALAVGREGTEMGPWGEIYPDFLLDDLTALVRSWATPPDEAEVPPLEPDLGQPIVHPTGPAADFSDLLRGGLFVSLDAVLAAYEAQEALVLLDARPGGDYVAGHITGAVPVPFYDAALAAPLLPADTWLVAYGAGPPVLAVELAQRLSDRGFTRVAVLEEGWFAWSAGGHAATVGPAQY